MHIDPQAPVFAPADILLPARRHDLTKWAVVACDQFTSQPEYWERGGEDRGGRALHPAPDSAGGTS